MTQERVAHLASELETSRGECTSLRGERDARWLHLSFVSDEARMVTGIAMPVDGGVVGVDHPKLYDIQNEMHPSLAHPMASKL